MVAEDLKAVKGFVNTPLLVGVFVEAFVVPENLGAADPSQGNGPRSEDDDGEERVVPSVVHFEFLLYMYCRRI